MMWRHSICHSAAGLKSLATTLCLILLLLPTEAGSNPLPESVLYTHVRPVAGDPCQTPLNDCEQIVQYTEATGLLEFELYFYPMIVAPPFVVSALQTSVVWPESWTLIDAGICNGGIGTIDLSGSSADLSITWPECPESAGELFLAAHFVLDVTGYGEFAPVGWGTTVGLLCPPNVQVIESFATGAEAGVECAFCFQPCDFSDTCHPMPDPTTLDLEIPQGMPGESDIYVLIIGGLEWPCTTDFSVTEDWMSIDPEPLDWNEWMLHLSIDTSGLDPGTYEGWVRMDDRCVGCTKVQLQVLEPTSGLPPDNPVIPETWGGIKASFRDGR